MTDHLIERYNAALATIQDREAADLDAALTIYVKATKTITDRSAGERMEAGIAHEAAMSQRNHEFHNWKPIADREGPEPGPQPPVAGPSETQAEQNFNEAG